MVTAFAMVRFNFTCRDLNISPTNHFIIYFGEPKTGYIQLTALFSRYYFEILRENHAANRHQIEPS